MADVTPTDRPKSVRNRLVIEVFGGLFVLSLWFYEFHVDERVFVVGLGQNSSFCSCLNNLFLLYKMISGRET